MRRGAAFSVLDAGCGFGHASCAIASRFPSCRVQAVDVEPSVLSAARARALRLGVESQIVFREKELRLETHFCATKFDVLLFLAAQQVFCAPSQIARWLGTFGAPGAISLLDRTAVVLPGQELKEAARFNDFLVALGPRTECLHVHTVNLSVDVALECIDMFLEDAIAGQESDLAAAQHRVRAGAVARSVSALYLVRGASSTRNPNLLGERATCTDRRTSARSSAGTCEIGSNTCDIGGSYRATQERTTAMDRRPAEARAKCAAADGS